MSHYDVLGVAPGATPAEVRQAYLTLARRHHPDRHGGDTTRMQALNEAWAVLGDPVQRARYDRSLDRPAPGSAPTATPTGPPRSDAEDLLADLADDRPIGGRVVLPGWLSLLPPACFAAAVGLVVGGGLFGSAPMLALGAVAFVVSCALFLAAPFVALLGSRRATSADRDGPQR